MSTNVTLTGTLGHDPELRFTPSGKAVASMRVVTSKSVLNKDTDKWENEEETWWAVTAWDQLAQNIVETLLKGDPVIVVGRTFMESYTDKAGNERQSLKVNAYTVGLDLKRRSASVSRTPRGPKQGASWSAGSVAEDDEPPF